MTLREFYRYAVRMLATFLSTEVGIEIAVGEFYLPAFRSGWKLCPPGWTMTHDSERKR